MINAILCDSAKIKTTTRLSLWLTFVILCYSTIYNSISAQEILTIEETRTITLENNFDIQIAANDVKLAENLTDKKVNGYLPVVTGTAGLSSNLGGSEQTFSNGLEAKTENALTWGANASVGTNYVLYDKRRGVNLDLANDRLSVAQLQEKQTIEQNLLQVYSSYYQIAQFSENIEALKEAIKISKDRLSRSDIQLDLGQGSGLQVLNAQVDIQRDSVNLLNAEQNLSNAKRNLNVLMGRDIDSAFEVKSADLNPLELSLESLKEKALSNNTSLLLNKQNLELNRKNIKLVEAENNPTFNAGAFYNYQYSDNPSGAFIENSNSRGLSTNIGLSWTLYDASRNIRKQNAIIGVANQELIREQLEQQLLADLTNAWTNYQNAFFIKQVEEKALKTNQENFDRTEELFNSGRVNSIDFRQAQLNYLRAQTSLNNAIFEIKLREVQLLLLTGALLE